MSDVLIAQNSLILAQTSLARAKVGLMISEAQLDLAMGGF